MIKKLNALVLMAALFMAVSVSTTVRASDEEAPESRISATFGADLYSHFISYGNDVWGGGATWNAGTFNPYAEVSLALDIPGFDSASVSVGTWWDVNDNADSEIGGSLQEVDIYAGVSVTKGPVTVGITGQEWYYPLTNNSTTNSPTGNTESVLDISIAIDDSQLIELPIAINPSFVAHYSSDADSGDGGWAYVFSVAPSATVYTSDEFDVELTTTISVAVSSNDFYAKSGLGYYSTGIAIGVPLKFIEGYGDWSVGAGITFYHTPSSSIPNNPDENIVVGNIGFSVGV